MKCLIAGAGFSPAHQNRQPWYYLFLLGKSLKELGHEVWYLSDEADGWEEEKNVLVEPRFRSFPTGIKNGLEVKLQKEKFDLVFWSTGLSDFFCQRKVDVLQLPAIAVMTSPLPTAKELFSLGADFFRYRKQIGQFALAPFLNAVRISRWLQNRFLKGMIFESQACRDRILSKLAAPLALPSEVLVPPLPEKFSEQLEQVKIPSQKNWKPNELIYYGPPVSLRGTEWLVAAVSALRKKYPNVQLKMYLRIDHEASRQQLKRLESFVQKRGLQKSVVLFTEKLSTAALISVLQSGALICLPFKMTVSEVPVVVLEVLAAGAPLLTTETAGVREFLQQGRGFCISVSEPQSLEKSLASWIEQQVKFDLFSPEAVVQFREQRSHSRFTKALQEFLNR